MIKLKNINREVNKADTKTIINDIKRATGQTVAVSKAQYNHSLVSFLSN